MIKRVIYVILTFLICIGLSNYTVYATDKVKGTDKSTGTSGNPRYKTEVTQETDTGTGGKTKSDLTVNPDEYKPASTNKVENASKLKRIGNVIIGVIRTVGSIVSVGALIVLGIKYMAGSIEEKAQYKQTMGPYVLGALMLFGITNILGVIIEVAGVFE